jgi:peptide/nickel transport system substrate-binding protein
MNPIPRQWGVRLAVLAALLLALTALVASTAGARQSGAAKAAALPRNETFYISGKQWGPYTDFNPLRPSDSATGVLGLMYETLFRFDPIAVKFIPWLATSGKWVGSTYVLQVRKGVKWSDGQALTPADVKFSFQTGKLEGSEWAGIWTNDGLVSISTKGSSVLFHFKGKPNYPNWDYDLYNVAIVPQHIWKSFSAKEIATGNNDKPANMVGTGPFVYGAGAGSSQTLQYNRRDGWWASNIGLEPKPAMKYVVDIHNTQNTASLQNFLQDKIDLSNNFFPGIDKSIGGKIQTYYSKAPFMLSANTAWLVPNTTKKPLNDVNFRRALAMSINVDRIVSDDYGHIVQKANQTGLLPVWNNWIDKKQATKLGFKYNIAAAKALLAKSGYKAGGDGFVRNKDGSAINLSLIVPNGWSDWMTAIQIIADSTKDAGIKITPSYPDYNTLVSQRNAGKFDLVITNDKQVSNSPTGFYDYLFRLPIQDQQVNANFARFTQAGAKPWALTLKLNHVPPQNVALQRKLNSQIQKYILTDLPAIPLWYNGMWAQYDLKYWKNFPTQSGGHYTPSTWNGYWNMTGIDALAHIKAAS